MAKENPAKKPLCGNIFKIVFELKGAIDPEKAQRACALSIEKYCSVAATLKAADAGFNGNADNP